MRCGRQLIMVLSLLFVVMPVHADETHPRGIVLDGTIGTAGKLDLPGPDYEIKAEYGHQAGANLFHSFQQFNAHSDESATFSGPASVQNIISRVTGGDASWIDGTLRSTISGADMYVLNPSGVMFGPNASLDLSGSFHVSTADYLRLGDNERFYTMPHESDTLSVAAPAAFGFLDSGAAPITIEGSGELTTDIWDVDYGNWWNWLDYNEFDYAGLGVPKGETLSVIGGDIEITGTYFRYEDEGDHSIRNQVVGATLDAPEGQICLAGIKSEGEVEITETGMTTSAEVLGNITLSDSARLTVSAKDRGGAGSIFIQGGVFVSENHSEIISEPYHGDGGTIDIRADKVLLQNGARISANAGGIGSGTDIRIRASDAVTIAEAQIKNGSFFYQDEGAGDGGTLSISAKQITVTAGAWLGGESYGTGKGGDIILEASESARISDYALIATSAKASSTGQAGDITITTPALNVDAGAIVESRSEGPGAGGDIAIHAGTLAVTDKGKLSAQALRSGLGGNLTVSGPDAATHDDFADSVRLSGKNTGMSASTSGTGNAGTISVNAKELSVTDNAVITTSASDTGNAGSIALNVENLNLSSGASVTSASQYPDASVHMVADPSELGKLSGLAQKGDVVIVQDAGEGKPVAAILDDGDYWVILTGDVFTVDHISELNDLIDYDNPADGEGYVVVVRDAGTGDPASYVYNGWLSWLELSKVYTVPDAEMRNQFVAFPGDVIRIDADGETSHLTYTGTDWIPGKAIHAVADLAERDSLSPDTGDIAKVEDVGSGAAKSFVFDGAQWISFYMTGQAGTISIHADDTVSLTDAAAISTSSTGGVHAGEIFLDTDRLHLDNATVASASESIGDSGTIHIRAAQTVTLSNSAGLITSTMGAGVAGDISLEARELELRDQASVSSESRAASDGGDAGTIAILAGDAVRLSDQSALTTEAAGAGGGKIFVNAGNQIFLSGSDITSSVKFGEGNGGDVTTNSEFVILNHSDITANADGGDGGAIFIRTENYLRSSDSSVTATSRRGNEGTVRIEAPDTDVSSDLVILPDTFPDASRWMKTPCSARAGEAMSRFVLKGRDATPASFEDVQASPLIRFGDLEGQENLQNP